MDFSNLKIRNINFTIRYKTKAMSFSSKNKPHHIIGLQLSGSAVHDFGYKKFTIEENCIYFLNQKDDYDVKVSEKCTAFSVHFTTYEPIETDSFCIKIENNNEILKLLQRIEVENKSNINEHRLMISFYSICSHFSDIYSKKYSPKDKRIIGIEEYLDSHFTEKNCLADAAEKCRLSRRRFNDVFKNSFNITPNKYLINLKINYAKKLLQKENISILEVSDYCGFSDIYYFSKVFKQEVGITPGNFRNDR